VEKASVEDSKKVVAICTKYAQKGMLNIFIAVFFATLAFAFVDPFFFCRLPDFDRDFWALPGDFYGERRGGLG